MERIDLRALEEILGIYSPWSIKSAKLDEQSRTFDVFLELGDRSRLFGLLHTTRTSDASQAGSWLYTNFGKCRVIVHAQIPGNASNAPALNYSTLNQACFLGSPIRQYSNYIRQQIALAHAKGLSPHLISTVLQLNESVVASVLDDLGAAPTQVQMLACLATELDPVWENLVRGEINLDTQLLPLKLLLSKLKQTVAGSKKSDALVPAMELRKFFVANASILGVEIEQIFGLSARASDKGSNAIDSVKRLVLPGLSNPVWQEVLTGRVQLNSPSVALNLLIARQKTAYGQAQQTNDKLAAIEVIRDYFHKNFRTLKAELLLLNRASAIKEKTRYRLPEVEHTVWQQILQDDTFIPSNHIAYKLLLARLRSQVRTAPNPATRLDAARRIRDFIKQNHKSMKQELVYLIKQTTAA